MFLGAFLLVVHICHIQLFFTGEKQRKSTKIQVKYVIENEFLLFQVIAREHVGTHSTLAHEHVGTQAKHVATIVR